MIRFSSREFSSGLSLTVSLFRRCCHITCSIADFFNYANVEYEGHVATSRKVTGSRLDEVNEFFNFPHPSRRTSPWRLLSPNRNEYHKQKIHVSGGVECGRCVGLTT
jgi:hypothetical protein